MIPDSVSISEIIHGCLTELRDDLGLDPLEQFGPDTPVYGSGSDLDSMAVVHLIADLEGRLYEKYNLSWILADERALSRTRSPFRTVGELIQFVMEIQPAS